MIRPTHLLSESNDGGMSDASLDLALREQSAQAGAAPQKRNALKLLHRLLRGRYLWLLFFGVVLGGACGYAGWKRGSKTYASDGVLKVNLHLRTILKGTDETYLPEADAFFQEQIENATSWRVLSKAVQHPEWTGVRPAAPDSVKDMTKATLRVQDLASHIKVTQKINQILIEGRDIDPRIAVAAARAVTDSYRSIFIDHEDEGTDPVTEALMREQKKLALDLVEVRKKIDAIADKYGSEKLDAQYANKLEQVKGAEVQIQECKVILDMAKNAPKDGDKPTSPDADLSVEALSASDNTLAGLLEEKQKLTLRMERARRGTSATAVADLESEMRTNAEQIDARHTNLLLARAVGIGIANLPPLSGEHVVETTQVRLAILEPQWKQYQDELMAIGADNRDLQELHGQETDIHQKLAQFNDRLDTLKLENPDERRVEVITKGDWPINADKDTRPKLAAVGGTGGLMAATALVMLMGYLSGKLKSPSDLQFDLDDKPLLGLIPQLSPGQDASKLAATAAEYVHRSRTMLEIWARGNGKMVIGVTSPSHGSGNTSVAMSLGVSFATAGIKTLLIDVDFVTNGLTPRLQTVVRRELGRVLVRLDMISEEDLETARKVVAAELSPKTGTALAVNGRNGHNGHGLNGSNGSPGTYVTNGVNPSQGTNKDKALGAACVKLGFITEEQLERALRVQGREPVGLLDALGGESLDNCVGRTGIRNLSILPRGNVTPAHAAKLSSHSMRQVLAMARQQYDTVIIDTSAVLSSLEAGIVASSVDGMVMTVARGEKRSRMMEAMNRLNSMGCPVAGVIFNHVLPKDMPPETNIGRVSTMNANADDDETIQANLELVNRLATLGPLASSMVSRVPVLDQKSKEIDE